MAHLVTLVPGDGIGPEVAEATRTVLDATGLEFEWDVQEAGAAVVEHGGGPPPRPPPPAPRRWTSWSCERTPKTCTPGSSSSGELPPPGGSETSCGSWRG